MKTYLVLFQISDLERSGRLISRIKNHGAWARLAETAWCVRLEGYSASRLRDSLSQELIQGDRLFVVDISNSAWGSLFVPRVVTNWLNGQ